MIPVETHGLALGVKMRLSEWQPDDGYGAFSFRANLGNGTSVPILITPLSSKPQEDGGDGSYIWNLKGRGVMVTILAPYFQSYPFAFDGDLLHASYVTQKLSPKSVCDGAALTELMGLLLGREIGGITDHECPYHA